MKPRYFATDWDLSSARAVTVLRRLNEVDGVPGSRLLAAAFGHERPLVDPGRAGVAGDQQAGRHRRPVPATASEPSELLDDVSRRTDTRTRPEGGTAMSSDHDARAPRPPRARPRHESGKDRRGAAAAARRS